jgi:hypothetical protein
LEWYDFNARTHLQQLGRFAQIDPLTEKSRRYSPYVFGNNNPVRFNDPDGMFSTDVTKNKDGTYTVIDGKADGDKNIYVRSSDNKRTGEVIGKSLTDYSFLKDDGTAVKGVIINPNDKSGADFLNNRIIGNQKLGLIEYMVNATGGEKYDFKTNGLANKPDELTPTQYVYRGMSVENVAGVGSQDGGVTTFASARDIGNVAAGYMAGSSGISEPQARFAFDLLESAQRRKIATEGMHTRQAEGIGYRHGFKIFEKQHPFKALLSPSKPYPPR